MAFVRKETFYEILGVRRNSTREELTNQFEELESFWKSVSLQSPKESALKLMELRNAYTTLSDPFLREKYDETLDFEFVLLDGKPKDNDIEEAYEVYRHNHHKTYHEILSEFQKFKNDLGGTLWMLKTTTLYLLFSLFTYSGIILLLTFISDPMQEEAYRMSRYKNLIVPVYILLSLSGYHFYRKYFQIPILKKRKQEGTSI